MDNPIHLQRRRKLDRPTLSYDLIEVMEVAVVVTNEHPEFDLIAGHEVMRYCYLEGYPERGARLPTSNPYSQGEGKRGHINSYVIGDKLMEWTRINQMCEPARNRGYVPERELARAQGNAMALDTWKDPEGALWFCQEATEGEVQLSLDSWVRQHKTIVQPPPAGWTLFTRPS